MKRDLTLSIIIPAYNEAKTIKKLVEKVKKVGLEKKGIKKEIIVIDDGSTDDTVKIVKRIKGIRVIISKKNGGKGAAVKKGIAAATGDMIIIQDADLEYDPNDYYKCIKPIIDKKTKIVYGSRFINRKQKTFLQKNENTYILAYIGGITLTLMTNLLYNAHITDEATCYKTFDAKFIKSIRINGNRFEWEPEILAKVRKKGEKIIEVPISYNPRSFEQGKHINWKDGFQAVWTLIKYRFMD